MTKEAVFTMKLEPELRDEFMAEAEAEAEAVHRPASQILLWSNESLQDREDSWDYIAKDNPIPAAEMDELFSTASSLLSDQTFLGKTGKVHGTREIIAHENY